MSSNVSNVTTTPAATTTTTTTTLPTPLIIIDLVVNYELSILFTTLSTLLFFLIGGILVVYAIKDQKLIGKEWNVALLGMAVILSILEMLSFDGKYQKVNHISRVVVEIVIGIICTVWGAFYFFSPRTRRDNKKTLNHGQHNLSTFVWGITIILLPFEIALFAGSVIRKDDVTSLATVSAMIQKLVQAGVYKYSLQYKIPAAGKQAGASWYFKLLALFNFLLWLNDLINDGSDDNTNLAATLGKYYSVFFATYSALVIDYRLLLTILFIEHSLSIDQEYGNTDAPARNRGDELVPPDEILPAPRPQDKPSYFPDSFRIKLSECSGIGNVSGLILCAVQLLNALQYQSNLGAWTNIFGIAADLSAIICGIILTMKVI